MLIDKNYLTEQRKCWLSEIIGIENCFYKEINEEKSYIKNLDKYITIFNYIDKILIILSATKSGVSIISFTILVGVSVGIASVSFTLIFSIAKGIIKTLPETTRNKKKMHDKIHMLAESKLDSIIIKWYIEISPEEFIIILDEKDRYERMKCKIMDESKKWYIVYTACLTERRGFYWWN